MENKINDFNKSWTVFLDRDGVINRQIKGDYVRNVGQFDWLPGSMDAIVGLSKIFARVLIVTNQQGVGKGLMKIADLEEIHENLRKEVEKAGGKIDGIYYCPYLSTDHQPCRKPEIGMALQAKKDFPDIDFEKSVMVGDSLSDIEFGKNATMKTVLINHDTTLSGHFKEDWAFSDLFSFYRYCLDNPY